jgi:hypothetical protein
MEGLVNAPQKNPPGNPKVTGIVGFSLFMLGMLSVLLVYLRTDVTRETLRLVLGAAVLLSLGCSSLAIAGLQRLELRVNELERRAGIS